MDAFIILIICAAFLTAILTAGRETTQGYRDDGKNQF